mgnify:CR=1 FL=1
MGRLVNYATSLHQATSRAYIDRMVDDKVHCMLKAKEYEADYWDGDRRYGYGGYKYLPGRWKPVAEALIENYNLTNDSSVLDVGCGEGWLMRELAGHGVDVAGFDAVAELVAEAIARGSKNCQCIAYEALDEVAWPQTFDLAVCNFSLLGESVEQPLRSLKQTLSASGHLLVQTLHPCFITRGESYCSTWLKGSWEGLPDHLHRQFKDAPPWYFRTLSDWSFVFQKAGYSIAKIDEPSMDDGSLPLSILFQLRPV